MTPDGPPPRALVAAKALALEVGLGALGGTLGVLLLSRLFLRAPESSSSLRSIAGLTLWCALLAVAVRLARATRARVRPALTIVLLGFLALWIAAPVALGTSFAVVPDQASETDPFRAWGTALGLLQRTFTKWDVAYSLAWGAFVPFVLVGVCLASRRRTPPLALALLGASAGYLGLVLTLRLLVNGLDLVLHEARQSFLCGLPCAVAAMALAPRLPSAPDIAATIEDADRRAWSRLALSILALGALMGAGARGHVGHAFDAMVRTLWIDGSNAGAFPRSVWLERLDDPREHVRWMSMQALATFGAAASTATPALLRLATHDESALLRSSAIDTIAAVCVDGIRYEATLPTMLELALNDPDAGVRLRAVHLLVAMDDPATPQAFTEGLAARSTRRAALLALLEWWRAHRPAWDYRRTEPLASPPALADALLRAYADPEFIHPDRAVSALFDVFDDLYFDFFEALDRALADDDPRVRRLAALTLRERDYYSRLTPEQRRVVYETE